MSKFTDCLKSVQGFTKEDRSELVGVHVRHSDFKSNPVSAAQALVKSELSTAEDELLEVVDLIKTSADEQGIHVILPTSLTQLARTVSPLASEEQAPGKAALFIDLEVTGFGKGEFSTVPKFHDDLLKEFNIADEGQAGLIRVEDLTGLPPSGTDDVLSGRISFAAVPSVGSRTQVKRAALQYVKDRIDAGADVTFARLVFGKEDRHEVIFRRTSARTGAAIAAAEREAAPTAKPPTPTALASEVAGARRKTPERTQAPPSEVIAPVETTKAAKAAPVKGETTFEAAVESAAVRETTKAARPAKPASAGERHEALLRNKPLPQELDLPEPVRRERIIKNLSKALNIPIFMGRVKGGKERLGFFKSPKEEIRTRDHNDLEITAHEVGHLLDFRYFKEQYKKNPAYKAELTAVSYDARDVTEGFAEFVRLYLTQENEAVRSAPQFYDFFVAKIEEVGLSRIMLKTQADMHAWYKQGALARARSKVGTPKLTIRERFDDSIDNWFARFNTKMFDAIRQVKMIEIDLAGGLLDATQSAYKALRLFAGTRGVIKAVFHHGTIGWAKGGERGAHGLPLKEGDIKFTGASLKAGFEQVQDKLDDTAMYFIGRRAQELAGRDKETGFRKDEIEAMVAVGANDRDIQKAFNDWRSFNHRMLDFYQDSGLISAEQRMVMEEMNRNYVPFQRVIEYATGEVKKGSPKPFMRFKGSTRNIKDLLDNITETQSTLIQAALLNRSKDMLYSMIDNSGTSGARFAVKVAPDVTMVKIDAKQINRALKKAGVEVEIEDTKMSELITHMVAELQRPMFAGVKAPLGPNFDSVMRNGKRVFYEIADPLLVDAMNSFGPKNMGLAIRIAGGFKTVLTRGVTLSPDFQARNLIRDSTMGFILTKSSMVPIIDSIKGMSLRVTKDEHYWEYLANGGGFVASSEVEAGRLRRDLGKFYNDNGINYATVLDTPQKLAAAWDELASASEYGTRLGEVKRLRKQGGSARESTFGGREISTDFAMRGSSDTIRVASVLLPFFNARLQGLYRLGRGMHDDPGSFALKASIITAATLLLYYHNKDDERYIELDDWIKDLHWVILIPEGIAETLGIPDRYLIPKPFEAGMLFASIPERIWEAIELQSGKKLAERLWWMTLDTFAINPVPQIVRPPFEVLINRKFTGAPIVPEDLKDVASPEQFRPWTSETMKLIASTLPAADPNNELAKRITSPLALEQMWRGYFGTMGLYVLNASDALLRAARDDVIPTPRLDERPVIRGFIRQSPLRSTSYQQEFFKLSAESREVVATFRKIVAENQPEKAKKFLQDDRRAILFALETGSKKQKGLIPAIRQVASEINGNISKVRLDKKKTGDEKRVEIDKLYRERNILFQRAMEKLSEKELEQSRRDMVKRRQSK